MNLILFERSALIESEGGALVTAGLNERQSSHIENILKTQDGGELRVGVVNGAAGLGRYRAATPALPHHVELRCQSDTDRFRTLEEWTTPPPAALPCVQLVVGLPRPQAIRKIVETVAAWGVARLIFVVAALSEKSFKSSKQLQTETVLELIMRGLEQGGHTAAPDILMLKSMYHLHCAPELLEPQEGLLLWADCVVEAEKMSTYFAPQRIASPRSITVAIGPERGWTDEETQCWTERKNFVPLSLGKRTIWRVENAVTAVLSQIDLISENVNPTAPNASVRVAQPLPLSMAAAAHHTVDGITILKF